MKRLKVEVVEQQPGSDPLLTQNPKKAGRAGRKQWKTRRANGGKKHKSEPKQLRFVRETTYGPEGRGFESLTAYQKPRETWFLVAFVFGALAAIKPPVKLGVEKIL